MNEAERRLGTALSAIAGAVALAFLLLGGVVLVDLALKWAFGQRP